MKFKFLTGDINWLQYGGKWVSKKLNNGEFDYWLVIELINMDDACGRDNEGRPTYNVSLSAVSPDQAGEENVKRALASCGLENTEDEVTDLMKVEMLHGYGISALIWQCDGNNAKKLLKEARQKAIVGSGLFGFFMDAPKNRIGTTGWECLRGDLTAGLARTIASGTTEGRILAKMHGIADAPPPPDQGAGPKP